jgi:hypothetical protein
LFELRKAGERLDGLGQLLCELELIDRPHHAPQVLGLAPPVAPNAVGEA